MLHIRIPLLSEDMRSSIRPFRALVLRQMSMLCGLAALICQSVGKGGLGTLHMTKQQGIHERRGLYEALGRRDIFFRTQSIDELVQTSYR